jgi:hypothetical protein
VHTDNNASYFYGATTRDTIHFSLTYLYCTGGGLLASSLTRFTASLRGANTAQLSWTMAGEQSGRQYEVQESRDGSRFTTVGTLPSVAGYSSPGGIQGGGGTVQGSGPGTDHDYDYNVPGLAQGKWYFRIKMDDGLGRSLYSEIRTVVVGSTSGTGPSLYPNPAVDHVNIILDPSVAGNWQVEVLAANGSLVQREYFLNARTARLNFNYKLAAGAYFIRATDQSTTKNYVSSFVIR